MAAPSQQDFNKGIDLTGVVEIYGSQINQVIDNATPIIDKGFIITTFDKGSEDPEVPNANTTIKWQRYLWRRVTPDYIRLYIWNPLANSNPLFLKWISYESLIITAQNTANDAVEFSQTAQSLAISANTSALSAVTTATTAKTTADGVAATAAQAQANSQAALDKIASYFNPGDIRPTFNHLVTYSIIEDEGWVLCNGASLLRNPFTNLFGVIGDSFGAADNEHFNVPDLRGRTIIGAGLGAGLFTARQFRLSGGVEAKSLEEANIPQHSHGLQGASVLVNAGGTPLYVAPAGGSTIGYITATQFGGSPTGFSLMNPYCAANWLIKT